MKTKLLWVISFVFVFLIVGGVLAIYSENNANQVVAQIDSEKYQVWSEMTSVDKLDRLGEVCSVSTDGLEVGEREYRVPLNRNFCFTAVLPKELGGFEVDRLRIFVIENLSEDEIILKLRSIHPSSAEIPYPLRRYPRNSGALFDDLIVFDSFDGCYRIKIEVTDFCGVDCEIGLDHLPSDLGFMRIRIYVSPSGSGGCSYTSA